MGHPVLEFQRAARRHLHVRLAAEFGHGLAVGRVNAAASGRIRRGDGEAVLREVARSAAHLTRAEGVLLQVHGWTAGMTYAAAEDAMECVRQEWDPGRPASEVVPL